ncbi:MAG: protein kinase domain-containing protein [Myxococcota bacterium]
MSISNYRPLSRGTVIRSRYEIEKFLGESLLGYTYVAKKIEDQRVLVIKFIKPDYASIDDLDRIRTLFEKGTSIKHPNVVKYGNVADDNGLVFFTQEYVPSTNLREWILNKQASGEKTSLDDAVRICDIVLDALAALHEAGIIHTNLKPENILIRKMGGTQPAIDLTAKNVMITDIMAARIIGTTQMADSQYRAPECRAQSGMTLHGPQADVYSVGNILYELLVGAPPKGTYLAPSELREDMPKELDDIIDLALAANPSDRYASPSDMKNAIRMAFAEGFSFAKQEVDNTNALIAMAIGVFFLAILGGYFFVMEKPDPYIEKMNADDIVREQVASQFESGLPSKDDLEKYNSRNPDMLYVPKGPVIIGRLNRELTIDKDIDGDGDPESASASTREDLVKVVDMEAFYIDRYEYPNVKGQKPVVGLSIAEAETKCEELGKRLCSSEEWEKACKGPNNRIYAYGDGYDRQKCERGDYILGTNADCAPSGFGVHGLSSGPREWTSTVAPSSGSRRIVKGGLKNNTAKGFRCAFFNDESENYADDLLGFRCCKDQDAPASKLTPKPPAPAEAAPAEAEAAPAEGAPEAVETAPEPSPTENDATAE